MKIKGRTDDKMMPHTTDTTIHINIWRVCLHLACLRWRWLANEFALLAMPRIVLGILSGREGVKVKHDRGLPELFEDLIFYLDHGGHDKGGDIQQGNTLRLHLIFVSFPSMLECIIGDGDL